MAQKKDNNDSTKTFAQVVQMEQARKNRLQVVDPTERKKALDGAIAGIEKQFGKGAIMKLTDNGPVEDFPHIPTNIMSLDIILGVMGMPRGRMIEIYGAESSTKTSLCLHIAGVAQKLGGTAAIVDNEHAVAREHIKINGVNVDELLISQPSNAEEALEITESLVTSGAVDVVIFDSTNAMVPKAELEGDAGDAVMGLQARLLSQACRKLAGVVAKSNTCLIFISQTRSKIATYGNPTVAGVGNSLKFYASIRLEMAKIDQIKKGEEVIGIRVRIKTVKNKVSSPFKQTEIDYYFDSGFSTESDLLEMAVQYGIVLRTGSWYSYNEQRIGNGRENAVQYLRDNKEDIKTMRNKIISVIDNKKQILDKINKATGEIIEAEVINIPEQINNEVET